MRNYRKNINRIDGRHWSTTRTEDFSEGYRKLFDLSYRYLDNPGVKGDYEYTDDKTRSTSPTNRPEFSWSANAGDISGNRVVHPTHEMENFIPVSTKRPRSLPAATYRYEPIGPKEKIIDWDRVGMLALVKIGLIKLIKLGILKIIVLIVMYKYNLYRKTVILKFLFVLKLLLAVKISILPFVFLPQLLRIFTSLLITMVNTIDP